MPRKWIAKRMAMLDPKVDFDEIWKLATAYRATDFTMNFVYAVTFPHFFVRELDALPLVDVGRGKVLRKADLRADDTSWKMQFWWHHGSRSESTGNNVEAINRLHAHYAKSYPDSFNRNGTYIYTLCYEAAGMHRLMRRIGMKGMSLQEQQAASQYWKVMAQHFRNAGGNVPLFGFPESFEGIMAFMDAWEAEEVPQHAYGPILAKSILDQFAERYFPRVLHPLARTWIVSLYPDHLIRAYSLKQPSGFVRGVFRNITRAMLWFGEHVSPDPTETFEERRLARRASATSVQLQAEPVTAPLSGGACPFVRLPQDMPGV